MSYLIPFFTALRVLRVLANKTRNELVCTGIHMK